MPIKEGAKVRSLRLKTRPDLHLLYLNRQRILAGRGLCHTHQSGLSQSLFSQLLAKLWTILVLRGHKGQPTQTPQLPAQLCLGSGVKDKRGSHKPQPRPTAQRTGLHGLPHPSFLHKALELTPSGPSAAQTMGIPVAQHRSSEEIKRYAHSSCPAHVCPSQFLLLSSQCIRSPRKLSCQPQPYLLSKMK